MKAEASLNLQANADKDQLPALQCSEAKTVLFSNTGLLLCNLQKYKCISVEIYIYSIHL